MPSMRSLEFTLLEIVFTSEASHTYTHIHTHIRYHHRIDSFDYVKESIRKHEQDLNECELRQEQNCEEPT